MSSLVTNELMTDARYTEGEECPEELVINFTVAQWSSSTVRDCITMFGARIIEVRIDCSCHLSCRGYCTAITS